MLYRLRVLTLASCISMGLLLGPMLITDAHALKINPSGTTVDSMDARPAGLNEPVLENHDTIAGGRGLSLGSIGGWAGMFGYDFGDTSYNFNNLGNITINKFYMFQSTV